MKKIIQIIFLMLIFGCSDRKHAENYDDTEDLINKEPNANNKNKFYDSLLTNFVEHTDNDLIKLTRQDSVSIEWMLDRVEETDSAIYTIFQIGHTMEDENHTNPRFITDGWLYIDSASQKVFEYDLPNDTLIEWK